MKRAGAGLKTSLDREGLDFASRHLWIVEALEVAKYGKQKHWHLEDSTFSTCFWTFQDREVSQAPLVEPPAAEPTETPVEAPASPQELRRGATFSLSLCSEVGAGSKAFAFLSFFLT